MKRSRIIDARRATVAPEVRRNVELSFQIVDRIQEVLEEYGLRQRDLARRLNKTEAEISKWMRGTHNFTLETVCAIEEALGCALLQVPAAPLAAVEVESGDA